MTPVEINGRVYKFEMTIDAMEMLEDLFSTPDKEVSFVDVARNVSLGKARYFKRFIWAALQKHHPEIDLPAASRLIDDAGGMYLLDAQLDALAKQTTADKADAKALGIDQRPRKAQSKRRKVNGSGVAASTS